MRKFLFSAFILASVFLFCSTVSAEENKFGYVEIQKAVMDSIAGKEAMESFKGEVRKIEEDILKEKEEIEKLGEVLQKQSMMLTDDIRREKEKDFLRRQRDYERKVEDSKAELQIKEAELTNDILEDLLPIIDDYGKKNNYSIIFEKSRRILLYASDALDITDKIVTIFDAQHQKDKK